MTAPNHPAPPAPTPTMAEAIAHFESWRKGYAHHLTPHGSPYLRREFATNVLCLDLALSAMRAVEAGPVAWGVFEDDGRFLTALWTENGAKVEAAQCRQQDGRAYPVRPLYAFPSPDGGSAK